jgi:hypothetical protein
MKAEKASVEHKRQGMIGKTRCKGNTTANGCGTLDERLTFGLCLVMYIVRSRDLRLSLKVGARLRFSAEDEEGSRILGYKSPQHFVLLSFLSFFCMLSILADSSISLSYLNSLTPGKRAGTNEQGRIPES